MRKITRNITYFNSTPRSFLHIKFLSKDEKKLSVTGNEGQEETGMTNEIDARH